MVDSSRGDREIDVSSQGWGSDFIADLLNAYGFEYVPFNPGASFRGIEESIVNYADNSPEVILTPHEGLTVAIAHGYAKATDEPAVCLLHDIVGSLNGAMGIYNAYVDRAPILMLAGNGPVRESHRRPWIDWMHTATDQGTLVREYVKWDAQPAHLDGAADSIIRGYNIAATDPPGPVFISLDHDVQEIELDEPLDVPNLSKFNPPAPMAPDPAALDDAADRLVEASLPVIVTGRVGNNPEVVDTLISLAETLGAPVVDTKKRHRYNFPNTHPLNLSDTTVHTEADVVLALDVDSILDVFSRADTATHELEILHTDFELIDIGPHDLEASSLTGDHFEINETAVPILSAVENAIPALLERVTERLDAKSRDRIADRFDSMEDRFADQRRGWEQTTEEGWEDTPISLPRLAAEIWDVIQDEEWVLVNGTLNNWSHRIWDIDSPEQYIGGYSGGGGVGYGIGGAIGGALVYADTGRTPINLQADGDLLSYLSGLWVLGHAEIPLFTVVHNNRTLYNSTNHRIQLARHRNRDDSFEQALIGTGLTDPTPDYAAAASSLGVSGYGPIEDPDELPAVIESAWKEAKNGMPVLVDVICQPR